MDYVIIFFFILGMMFVLQIGRHRARISECLEEKHRDVYIKLGGIPKGSTQGSANPIWYWRLVYANEHIALDDKTLSSLCRRAKLNDYLASMCFGLMVLSWVADLFMASFSS